MNAHNRYQSKARRHLLILFMTALLLMTTSTVYAYDEAEDANAVQPQVTAVDPITFLIPVAADAEVNTHDKDENFGGVDEMKVLADAGGNHFHRPLFHYDLTSVLPGSAINSGTAWFYVTEKDSNPVYVHRVTTRWEEDSVTWDSFNEGFFAAPSGSFIPDPTDQVHGVSISALVEDWVTGAERNRGLALIPSVEKKDSKYATKEDSKLERHSYLEVVVDNAAIRTYADDFAAATTYTGSDGSEFWSFTWQEIGENNGPSAGLVQVIDESKCPNSPCLKIGEVNGSLTGVGIRRQVDLSAAVAATLSFSYQREDANVLLHVEVSADGGSNWHRLDSIALEHGDDGYNFKSYDISSYIDAATQIRFVGEQIGGSNDKGIFIDDVRVAYLDSLALDSGIGNKVWDDSNRDGVQDGGEQGIEGVQIDLYTDECGNADGPPYRSTDTNAVGEYFFANLYAGDYCLVVDGDSLPADYVPTSDSAPFSMHLNTSEVVTTADFGYASAYAGDRLTVGTYAPCTDITWLQQHATNNSATFLTEDYEACSFTLGAAVVNMAGVQADVAGDTNTLHSGPDVFTSGAQVFPNDPHYNNPSYVYGPQQINALAAWSVTTGDPNLIVAVLDTGVDPTHPEYAARLLSGWDFVNDDNDPSDDQGHGTHIAGIIAAGIDNGIGIAGMAGDVRILPVKVLGANGSGWWSDVADGVTWAVDQGAKVLNLSLAGSVDSYVLHDAIAYANSRGAIVVVAAGNESTNSLQYPASYSDVLSSGATTYTGERWSLSNYGPNVDVVAPGALVYATQMGGDYRFMSGTSMAAPHVAGLAALLLSRNPNLTSPEIIDIILNTAVDMGDAELHGAGLIDAGAAVTSINTEAYAPPVTSTEAQLVKDLSANGIIDPGDTVRYNITIANANVYPFNNVIVSATIPDNTIYVTGTTSLNGIPTHDDSVGTLFPLDEGGLNIGTVPANSTTAVSFDVTVDQPPPAFYTLFSEARVDDGTGVEIVDVTTPVGGDACSLSLRNDVGTIITSLRIGYDLHLSLIDPDENSHPGKKQSVIVNVANSSTGDSETITLIETGVDTGAFEGNIQLSKALGQVDDDGYLNASAGSQTVSVSYSDPDFSPDLCIGSITTISPGSADLRVTQTVSDSTPDEDQSLVFTVKVKNNGGPNDATSVVISDVAPTGINFITGQATHGDFDYENGVWTVGQLPVGVEAVLTTDAEVSGDSGSTINNVVFVQAVDQTDPVSSNDSASIAVSVNPTDLQMSKAVNIDDPDEGETVRYTINVKNDGPAALATDIVISDVLPAGMIFKAATAEQGSYDDATGLWTVGDLADGANVDLFLDAMYTSGYSGQPITNSASVHSFGQADNNSVNDRASATLTPKTADLRVQKSVDDSGPLENQPITYTVMVKNQGPAALATGIVVSDVLPSGLTFASAVAQQGSYNSTTGLWTVGNLASGVEVALNMNATVNDGTSGQRITNRAEVYSFDQLDHAPTNDFATKEIVVAPADLEITKSVNNDKPDEEEEIQYTIIVENDGPSFATGIVIRDVLPATLTFVSANEDVGDYNSATGLWTLNTTLNAGQSKKMVIKAKPKLGTSGQTISNWAEVAALNQLDDDPSNDFDEIDVNVNGVDIIVSVGVDENKPGENMQIEYMVSVKNNGPAAIASGIVVSDLLPSELTFISADPEQGSYNPSTHVWRVGSLNHGQIKDLVITAYVPNGTYGQTLTYLAQLVSVDQFEIKASNNSPIKDITVSGTDIEVTKTIKDNTLSPGMLAEYTIEVRHNGPADNIATGIVISDVLPAGVIFDSANPDQGTYDENAGLWSIGSMSKGQTKKLVIEAVVDPMNPAVPTVVNTADFYSMDQQEDTPANNTASIAFSYEDADIWVEKKVNSSAPDEGDVIDFTIEARNYGSAKKAGTVRIQDILPAGLTYVGSLADAGSYNPATGIWTIPELSEYNGTVKIKLVIQASVDAGTNGTTITNTATLQLSQPDPLLTNNSDSAVINVRAPDIQITKSVNDATPDEFQPIVYTVSAKNTGPADMIATGVVISDLLPVGVSFEGATAEQGSYDAGTGLWTVGGIPKGVTYKLLINATVDAGTSGTTITNTAAVHSLTQVDTISTNDQASAPIAVNTTDLRVLKSVNDDTPDERQIIIYKVNVKNLGPSIATSVVVSDLLPSGVTYVRANKDQGAYNKDTSLWTVGTLDAGVSVNLYLEAKVDEGVSGQAIVNTATLHSVAQVETVPGNNTASVAIDVQKADMLVTKTVNDDEPDEGEIIVYTVKIKNQGPSLATGVVMEDILPAGVTYITHVATHGLYDRNTGLWVVGDLIDNATATLTINAVVDRDTSGQSIDNTASLRNVDQDDPITNNNSATVRIDVRTADLRVQKAVNDTTPIEGQAIAYTVKVKNQGPSLATGIQVADVLPNGVTFVSAAPAQGSYDVNTGIWAVGDLNSGVEKALVINMTVDAGTGASTIVNRAGVFAVDQADDSHNNDQDSVAIIVGGADLDISKTVDIANPSEGQAIRYELTLVNNGPDDATGIQITDLLPAGVTYIGDNSGGAYNPATGVWTIPQLNEGNSKTMRINATVDTGTRDSVIVNAAEISASDQPDSLIDNNYAEAKIAIGDADLQVSVSVDDATPSEGDPVVYTVQVENKGPNTASAVELTFPMSPGLRYASHSNTLGSYSPATGIWTVGNLSKPNLTAAGANAPSVMSATLVLSAVVEGGTAAQTIAATSAVVGADQSDPTSGNNQATASMQVHGADLSLTKVVDDLFPQVGDTVIYTISLNNAGPDTATNIEVTDLLPNRIQFVLANVSDGSYDADTGLWTIASLAASRSASLEITSVLTEGIDSSIANIAELTAVDQPDGDSIPNNHAPGEDDQAVAELYTGVPPVIDGKVDQVYKLSPNSERVCYTANGVLFGVWYVLAQPSEDAVYVSLSIDRDFVDNTYGTNIIGWNSHSFGELVGSDHAQFIGYDANGVEATDFKIDYISSGYATPSGYDTEGVISGDVANVLETGTSLSYNLNQLGYCADGDCSILGTGLLEDSPATDVFYTPNVTYPDWIYDVVYEAKIDNAAFGPAGFGSIIVPYIHASPAKGSSNTIIAVPGICPGEIGDYVWHDADTDGLQDDSENGIDNVSVSLYQDNGDGVFVQAGDTLIGTETTQAGGRYLFQDVEPGTYFVDVVDGSVPAGFSLNTSNDPTSLITITSEDGYRDVDFGYASLDFGDAPDLTFPTLHAHDGAHHIVDGMTYLGAGVDSDPDGQPNPSAMGDDDNDGSDDEDGVIFSPLRQSQWSTLDITASKPGRLNAWIDYAGAGNRSGAGEQVFIDYPLVAGVNQLNLLVPLDANLGTTYARFRFSSLPGLSYIGEAPDGEVEDYQIEIDARAGGATGPGGIGGFVWHDQDGDGIQDPNEPGIGGVIVELTDGLGVTTTANTFAGNYGFTNLPAGTYTVNLDAASVPPDYNFTTTPTQYVADLAQYQNYLNADFGLQTLTTSYTISKELATRSPARPRELVTFDITITNTGSTWLAIVPLQDDYDPDYLLFKSADTFPDAVDEVVGVLNWDDVTAIPGHDLAPLESFTVSVTFEAVKDTTDPWQSPNGATVNTATVSNAWADPDGPGSPLGPDIALPEQWDDDEIQIILPTGLSVIDLQVVPEIQSVKVSWRTVSEVQFVGFNVLRTRDGSAYEVLNSETIIAEYAGADQSASYVYVDAAVQPGMTYQYVLETIRSDGSREWFKLGPVMANWSLSLPLIVDN